MPCIDPLLGVHVHGRQWHSVLGAGGLRAHLPCVELPPDFIGSVVASAPTVAAPPDVVGSGSASCDFGCAAALGADAERCSWLRSPCEDTVADSASPPLALRGAAQ